MEKEAYIRIAVFLIPWIYSRLIYLPYTIKKYGKQKSISAAAEDHRSDGNMILVFLFIWGGQITKAYVAQSWPMIISAGFLFFISLLTGYNPNYPDPGKQLNKTQKLILKYQDIIHVICTMGSIGFFMLEIILKTIYYWHLHLWLSITIIIITIPIIIYCIRLYIKQSKNHTWDIENAILILSDVYIVIVYIFAGIIYDII